TLFRMFAGRLPEYPFDWPPPGHRQLQKKLSSGHVDVVRRAIDPNPRKRFADAAAMQRAFGRLRHSRGNATGGNSAAVGQARSKDWKTVQRNQFLQEFGKTLGTMCDCQACGGPVSETMQFCPWCAAARRVHEGGTRFPQECPRCRRGLKLDWLYCPWCFGPGFEPESERQYSDARYSARCHSPDCSRKQLMPFMRYCPWCRRKVRRKWKLPNSASVCSRCGWGVAADYWSYCPWCAKRLGKG
ncbi:MAG: zinc ribbon domain-containing protein, partial [Planctomycetota bacterium]